MYITADPKSSVPLNDQIKEQIRLAVATGVLRPGEQLPTVREIAGRLRLNPNTVARAYRELQMEGLLTARQGSGTFVSEDARIMGEQEGLRLVAERLRKASGLAADLGLGQQEFVALAERALRDAVNGRKKDKGEATMPDLAIETSGLTRRYGKLLAVDDVALRVPMGSVYGYLGRNGAGKTTTIHMLMGFIEPNAGKSTVMGFDPLREDVEMKKVVSYVPERVQMYDWMKVREVMWFGANIHPRWDKALGEALLARFELPRDRKIGELSRGMQGKLALALALSSHPKLLILDDPTSGLDALVRREFMESIVTSLQEAQTTVFFSSHIIDDVERVADWVGILDGGKLIVQKPLEELKAQVKRIVATFPDTAPKLDLPGVLQQESDGRQQALIVEDFSPAKAEALKAAGATSVQVEDCSLEDIFVAYVRTKGVPAM